MIGALLATAVLLPGGTQIEVTAQSATGAAEVVVAYRDDAALVSVAGPEVTNVVCEVTGQTPTALAFGNGWYVTEPGDLASLPNGHMNATSFDGFLLRDGTAVVMASERPIQTLFVRKDERRFGIRTAESGRFTFVHGRQGLFEAAIRYREKYDTRKAAPGVAVKAGKFCVDAWNGRYAEHADFIDAAAAYGLTNDLFFYSHQWQRYGYDYHLPDVYPPNPVFGTTAEMKLAQETARRHGWYFGVHLNTSDFYTDASDFAFDKVAHDRQGKPIKAWYNAFRKAQSYRMSPDYAPVSMRKVLGEMNADGFVNDTIFVDVIGSGPAKAYCTQDGQPRPQSHAVAKMGEVFDVIRETQTSASGRPAFTSSEAACDVLMGHLDGGDCQFLMLGAERGEYRWERMEAGDIVKVPWFDAVNHARFSLHGVGYSIRYEGGRGEDCHGIDSDDYYSLEMLTGHALMSDAYSRDVRDVSAGILRPFAKDRVLRQVVRAYWLGQHIVRATARDDMASVVFADGDVRRQIVTWKGGMTVYVNRGASDWTVADGVVLPEFGFYAKSAKTGAWAKIAKFRTTDGHDVVAEASEWKDGAKTVRYVNGRGFGTPNLLPYTPQAAMTSFAADRLVVDLSFARLTAEGHVCASGSVPRTATLWLVRRKTTENNNTLPDYRLASQTVDLDKGTGPWCVTLPPGLTGVYDLLVSLTPTGLPPEDNFEGKDRFKLLGTPSFFKRYHLGRLDVKKGVFTPFEQKDRALWPRLFAPSAPVDFGFCRTTGAFRQVEEPGKAPMITPLPGER